MRRFILFFFSFISLIGNAQHGHDTARKKIRVSIVSDSQFAELKKVQDSLQVQLKEKKEWEDKNREGFNALLRIQDENRKREKRQALIRIGLGLFFLAVLIVGLSRRRKKSPKV